MRIFWNINRVSSSEKVLWKIQKWELPKNKKKQTNSIQLEKSDNQLGCNVTSMH
jgi:hypothetical protein